MTALYAVVAQYRADLDALAALELDDPQTIADTLESMQGEITDKLRAVIAYALNLRSEAEQQAAAAQRMADRATSTSNQTENLLRYARESMQVAGLGEIATDEWAAKLTKTPGKVVIAEGAMIPAQFMRTPEPPPPAPDKQALKAALSTGTVLPGVSLVSGYRLAIK